MNIFLKSKKTNHSLKSFQTLFAGLNVWHYSQDRIFHYELVEKWLEPYSYNEIKRVVLNTKVESLDNIRIIRDHSTNSVYLVFPDSKAVEITIDSNYEKAHREEDILKYTLIPAYSNEDGSLDWQMPNQTLWDVKWIEDNSNNLDFISLGGRTDFYDRFGWWPHVNDAVHRVTNEMLTAPLRFIGTINLNGTKGYIFNDIDYYKVGDYRAPYEKDGTEHSFVLVLENDLKVPYWIDKKELNSLDKEHYVSNLNCGENVEKRIIPVGIYPIISPGCQDDYTLQEPFNNFVVQIPVIYYGFDKYDDFYRINEGDLGTLTICSDNKGQYRASYQQT